jgi:hypothetical protein
MNMDSEDDHEDYPWADFFMASSTIYIISLHYVIQVSDSQGIFIDYNMLFPYQPWYHP